jgi:hypothetical protein
MGTVVGNGGTPSVAGPDEQRNGRLTAKRFPTLSKRRGHRGVVLVRPPTRRAPRLPSDARAKAVLPLLVQLDSAVDSDRRYRICLGGAAWLHVVRRVGTVSWIVQSEHVAIVSPFRPTRLHCGEARRRVDPG